jgi:hypothetical protein
MAEVIGSAGGNQCGCLGDAVLLAVVSLFKFALDSDDPLGPGIFSFGGVWSFRRFRGDKMLNFLYAEGRKMWRSRETFLAEKCATNAACAGVGCWPRHLSPNPRSATLTGVGQGIGRVDARATDADVSVCRSVREGGFGAQRRQTRQSQLRAVSPFLDHV